MEHLQNSKVLVENQHGYRAGHSCKIQSTSLVEDLLHAMNNHYQNDINFVRFYQSIGAVTHRYLLAKLLHNCIRGHIHKWIKTFLTQQTKQVMVDGVTSCLASVTFIVLQDTVLGTLMLLIYVNDIAKSASSTL